MEQKFAINEAIISTTLAYPHIEKGDGVPAHLGQDPHLDVRLYRISQDGTRLRACAGASSFRTGSQDDDSQARNQTEFCLNSPQFPSRRRPAIARICCAELAQSELFGF